MTKGSVLLAAAVALVVAACNPPPEFVASLSDSGSVEYDERVLGHWYWWDVEKYPVDLTSFASVKGDSGGELEVRFLWGDRLWRYVAFPSRVDDVLYYNLVRIQSPDTMDYTAPGEKPGHIIVRAIHPSPDTMLVCVLLWGSGWEGEKTLSEALRDTGLAPRFVEVSPRINGKPVDTDNKLLHTLIDGSRENLLRLVRENPAFYFGAAFVFTRLGTAWPGKEFEDTTALKQKGDCRF